MSAFRFKHFSVEQSDVAMKVGTDGVLLGAWADVEGADSVLDIGTGTGVIALMVAQRSSAQRIVGVDIDENAARCAAQNFASSPWAERLSAVCKPAQEMDNGAYDLIISNPPYFSDSLLPPDVRRTMARHTTAITFAELDETVCRLLAPQGRFALILPTDRMEEYARCSKLQMVRRCDVYPVPHGTVKRVMAEFVHPQNGAECRIQKLTIENGMRGDYTDEYRLLTKDFYLKF